MYRCKYNMYIYVYIYAAAAISMNNTYFTFSIKSIIYI